MAGAAEGQGDEVAPRNAKHFRDRVPEIALRFQGASRGVPGVGTAGWRRVGARPEAMS